MVTEVAARVEAVIDAIVVECAVVTKLLVYVVISPFSVRKGSGDTAPPPMDLPRRPVVAAVVVTAVATPTLVLEDT